MVRSIHLFPVGGRRNASSGGKITQPDFYAIASAPNLITIIQDARPDFAEAVAANAPGARGRGAAPLLDKEFASGCVSLAPVCAVRQNLAGKLSSDLCA
jgi:hypothetical protein